MATKIIPLHELTAHTEQYLKDCVESGETLVVELPDRRRVTMSPFDPDDDLVNDLIEHNAEFQALLAKSAASPRKPFPTKHD
jgi:hypothetical protein